MAHLPVHWSEGMFIGPHHFQAGDRYWHDVISTGLEWNCPYGYGIKTLTIVEESLANCQLQLLNVEARLRDGTLVRAAELELGREELETALNAASDSGVYIFLGVAKLELGRGNTGTRDARYVTHCVENLPDENEPGNDQDIEFRRLNGQLFAGSSPPKGYETIRLMRVLKSGTQQAVPQLDNEYIPPMIDTGFIEGTLRRSDLGEGDEQWAEPVRDAGGRRRWTPLCEIFMQPIFHLVGLNLELLAKRAATQGLSFGGSRYEGDLEDLYRLTLLNRAFAVLKNFGVKRGVHPFEAFVQLCRLYGELAMFDPRRRVDSEIPAYDHDDLYGIFKWLDIRIRKLIAIGKIRYRTARFKGDSGFVWASLQEEWTKGPWDWYLGVKGQSISDERFRDWLTKLHCKMASRNEIDSAYDSLLEAPIFTSCPAPAGLPAHEGWIFYEIRKEGVYWKDISATRSLALKVNPKHIRNLGDKEWQERGMMDLLNAEKTEHARLEFLLFLNPQEAKHE